MGARAGLTTLRAAAWSRWMMAIHCLSSGFANRALHRGEYAISSLTSHSRQQTSPRRRDSPNTFDQTALDRALPVPALLLLPVTSKPAASQALVKLAISDSIAADASASLSAWPRTLDAARDGG